MAANNINDTTITFSVGLTNNNYRTFYTGDTSTNYWALPQGYTTTTDATIGGGYSITLAGCVGCGGVFTPRWLNDPACLACDRLSRFLNRVIKALAPEELAGMLEKGKSDPPAKIPQRSPWHITSGYSPSTFGGLAQSPGSPVWGSAQSVLQSPVTIPTTTGYVVSGLPSGVLYYGNGTAVTNNQSP